jgi:hypothetical protein
MSFFGMSGSVWYLSVSKKQIEFKKYSEKKKIKKLNKKLKEKSSKLKKTLLSLIFITSLVLFSSLVSAAEINDSLHINLQTTYANGSIETGTFVFGFNITESSSAACSGPIVYNHSTQKATDVRGIVSIYLPTAGSGGGNLSTLDFDKQYYLCYYRDSTLKDVSQLGRVPYSFRATQVNLSEISVDTSLNLTDQYNITDVDYGFFNFLGNLAERITKIFATDLDVSNNVSIGGNLSVGGDANVTGTIYQGGVAVAGVGDCPSGQFVQNTTTGGVECATPAGGGDVTGVLTTLDNYLYNGSTSGDIYWKTILWQD